MRRMNDDVKSKEGKEFFLFAHRKIDSLEKMRRTPEAKEAAQASSELANRILEAMDNAKSIEDLIHYEMVLQKLDLFSARTQRDKTSVRNAQRDYQQLSQTVSQMRENPAEYFRANIAFRGTHGDFRKMPRGRIQHITINVARLQERAAFAYDDEQNVCEARIKLAKKTIASLRTLHEKLVKEREAGEEATQK